MQLPRLGVGRLARGGADPRRWALWTQPPRLIGYCLLVELGVVLLTVVGFQHAYQAHDLRLFGALAGIGIAQTELARQVERVRRRLNATPHINMTSVWTFAAVLLLPVDLVVALVVVLYTHLSIRVSYSTRRVPPFRAAFNASLVILTCLAARGVLLAGGYQGIDHALRSGTSGMLPVVLAAATYFVVGAVISIPGLSVKRWTLSAVFGSASDNALEFTTLCLGAVNAVLLSTVPVLAVALVPPLLLLQRSVLVRQLEIAATTDDKTGVFNTAGWHHLAARELARAARLRDPSVGILMIDLDHFKRVNDRHGHLAGDAVLKAVADRIAAEVREYDSVGRFGGEEFVVLLPGTTRAAVCAVAERIRHAIATMQVVTAHGEESTIIDGLSVSIGVAMYPTAGAGIDRLLQAADAALYRAKSDGRNQVVTSDVAA